MRKYIKTVLIVCLAISTFAFGSLWIAEKNSKDDMKEFAQRFASMPARIKERQEAWESLSNLHQIRIFVLSDTSESQLQVIKKVRAWAAPRISSDQTVHVTDNKEKNNEQ